MEKVLWINIWEGQERWHWWIEGWVNSSEEGIREYTNSPLEGEKSKEKSIAAAKRFIREFLPEFKDHEISFRYESPFKTKQIKKSIYDRLKQQKTYVVDRLADKFMPVNGLLGFGS